MSGGVSRSGNGTCFVISPIGSEGSETRARSDKVFQYVIEEAVASRGYRAVRADHIDSPGMITSQVIAQVVEAELVVADLTDANPNVFYELAIRHALRRPLVQMIQQGQKIPFDVHGMRTIPLDHADLSSVHAAKQAIVAAIDAMADGDLIETPVSVSLDLQALRSSGDVEDRTLSELVDAVTRMRSEIQEGFDRLVAASRETHRATSGSARRAGFAERSGISWTARYRSVDDFERETGQEEVAGYLRELHALDGVATIFRIEWNSDGYLEALEVMLADGRLISKDRKESIEKFVERVAGRCAEAGTRGRSEGA